MNLYRGLGRIPKYGVVFNSYREKERKPVSTPPNIHEYANKWFLEKFKISARSSCVFVTPNRAEALKYTLFYDCSAVIKVKPIGGYNLIFSEEVVDMNHYLYNSEMSEEDVFKWLEARSYQLVKNIADLPKGLGSEIMLDCSYYEISKDEEFWAKSHT